MEQLVPEILEYAKVQNFTSDRNGVYNLISLLSSLETTKIHAPRVVHPSTSLYRRPELIDATDIGAILNRWLPLAPK